MNQTCSAGVCTQLDDKSDWTNFWLFVSGAYYLALVTFYLVWTTTRNYRAKRRKRLGRNRDVDLDDSPIGPEATKFYNAFKKAAVNIVGVVGLMGLRFTICNVIDKVQGSDIRFFAVTFLAPIPITMFFAVLKANSILRDLEDTDDQVTQPVVLESTSLYSKLELEVQESEYSKEGCDLKLQ